MPIATAEPGPPAAPAAGPGTYSEAPSGDASTWEGGDVLPLVTAQSSLTARGRHRVACDWGNRQPQNREAESQAAGALLLPAPHWQGRIRGAPTNPESLGNRGHGGLQGLLQAAVAAELLQTLPAQAMTTSPGMCGVPTQHSCTRAQPQPPQPQPAAAAEPALQPRAPGSGRRRLSQEGAIRKSKENPSWRSRCRSIFPASMSLLLAWLAVEPSVVLRGGALRQSITYTPHAHQHWLQLLWDQFGWLLKADFPQLPFAATLPFYAAPCHPGSTTCHGWAQ